MAKLFLALFLVSVIAVVGSTSTTSFANDEFATKKVVSSEPDDGMFLLAHQEIEHAFGLTRDRRRDVMPVLVAKIKLHEELDAARLHPLFGYGQMQRTRWKGTIGYRPIRDDSADPSQATVTGMNETIFVDWDKFIPLDFAKTTNSPASPIASIPETAAIAKTEPQTDQFRARRGIIRRRK